MENLLVERVIVNAWRLRRIYLLEVGLFTYHRLDARADHEHAKASSLGLDSMSTLSLGEVHDAAIETAHAIEAQRDADEVVTGWIRDACRADTFAKLSRYETAIECGMYKALHELQRCQAARAGHVVPVPAVVDVAVSTG